MAFINEKEIIRGFRGSAYFKSVHKLRELRDVIRACKMQKYVGGEELMLKELISSYSLVFDLISCLRAYNPLNSLEVVLMCLQAQPNTPLENFK